MVTRNSHSLGAGMVAEQVTLASHWHGFESLLPHFSPGSLLMVWEVQLKVA